GRHARGSTFAGGGGAGGWGGGGSMRGASVGGGCRSTRRSSLRRLGRASSAARSAERPAGAGVVEHAPACRHLEAERGRLGIEKHHSLNATDRCAGEGAVLGLVRR